jgi:hypothetical protein
MHATYVLSIHVQMAVDSLHGQLHVVHQWHDTCLRTSTTLQHLLTEDWPSLTPDFPLNKFLTLTDVGDRRGRPPSQRVTPQLTNPSQRIRLAATGPEDFRLSARSAQKTGKCGTRVSSSTRRRY